ncbi:MAG: hypothetical protein LC714_02950 [Actinobacteria bacterium]|nr:hypothetical protein [Actinomycetota bacterium]
MAEGPGSEFKAAVLAAYSVRRRVVRSADGTVGVLWGSVGLRMSLAEFLDLAGVLAEAMQSPARYGEIARGDHARVVRCSMGQVTLHHGDLTLWFSPEEFEELANLTIRARGQLADFAPTPRIGLPWVPRQEGFFGPN